MPKHIDGKYNNAIPNLLGTETPKLTPEANFPYAISPPLRVISGIIGNLLLTKENTPKQRKAVAITRSRGSSRSGKVKEVIEVYVLKRLFLPPISTV
jgi:hypothetical protein